MVKIKKYLLLYNFIIFFSLLICIQSVQCDLQKHEHVFLDKINFSHLHYIKRVQQEGVREVYKDKDGHYYYKVWCRHYKKGNDFIRAVKDGFYEGIAAPFKIIYDRKGYCRGYIIEGGIEGFDTQLKLDTTGSIIQRDLIIADFQEQTDMLYKDFYCRLLDMIREAKHVFIDYVPYNIIFIHGNYKLIDLESVTPLDKIGRLFFSNIELPKDYREDVRKIQQDYLNQ